jgi:RNase H-like domain found in reverse transcriptase
MQAAFAASKEALCAATELAHPLPGAEILLAVDASGSHVGAMLQQHVAHGSMQPLGFFSAKLGTAQQKYSAFDRELLACYLAVRHFRWMLEGRKFCIYSDHKPLTFALHRASGAWSARQQRHLSYVAEYTSDIRHVPGKQNCVADALSRPAAAVTPAGGHVDFSVLAAAQKKCADIATLKISAVLKIVRAQVDDCKLLCDNSTGTLRPLVPTSCRQMVFAAFHQLAHAGHAQANFSPICLAWHGRGCRGVV